MAKFLLFVCLALFSASVYCTQIRVINAMYDVGTVAGLAANLEDFANTTIGKGIKGAFDFPYENVTTSKIPATGYDQLPEFSFKVGTPLRISAIQANDPSGPPYSELAGLDITLQEDQSYSFVYVEATKGYELSIPYVDFKPAILLAVEEIPPSPIPYGKALVRVVNVAVSTWNENATAGMPMVVTINGTGVAAQQVTVPFGEASEFLEFDSAADLTLYTTLPVDGGSFERIWFFKTTIDATVVIYVRGDVSMGDDFGNPSTHLGTLDTTVPFPPAPPTAPVAPPTTPMAADPSAEPMSDGPSAPVASTTPTAPTSRTPTKRVSSAAQTVAQIGGVVALAFMLL